jgi:hypothetical protein
MPVENGAKCPVLADLRFQEGNSCAEMGCRIVKKLQHLRVPFERLLHDAALYPEPAAVYQAHFPKTGRVRLVDVLFDNGPDVRRREGVQVERAVDWNLDWVLILHGYNGEVGLS